jgi:hypothetical protein
MQKSEGTKMPNAVNHDRKIDEAFGHHVEYALYDSFTRLIPSETNT